MLAKSDLERIREIIREEVENEAEAIKDELGADIRMSGIRVSQNLDEFKDRIKNLEIRVRRMNKEDIEEDLYYANEE